MGMSLADYTSPGLILPCVQSPDARGVIADLCSTLERHGRIEDGAAFHDLVVSREERNGTAMAPRLVLPHARLAGIPGLCFALGRTAGPITWFGGAAATVRLVFLFAIPEPESGAYLGVISALAKLGSDPARLERLVQARDQRSLLDLLAEAPLPRQRMVAARTRGA